jgi:hypothetical protein
MKIIFFINNRRGLETKELELKIFSVLYACKALLERREKFPKKVSRFVLSF